VTTQGLIPVCAFLEGLVVILIPKYSGTIMVKFEQPQLGSTVTA